MEAQKLFRNGYVAELMKELTDGRWKKYSLENFVYNEDGVIPNIEIMVDSPRLILPELGNSHDLENSKIFFEAYKQLSPVQATDIRMWTYLSHVTYWEYMIARRPVEKQPETKRTGYILTHWFIERVSASSLLRNEISLLWWVAYLTYDEKRENPYELTEEAFSMLDYTRHLLPGTQGRNKVFANALLEYVIENKKLFERYKESKVRFLMRKANYLAGYRVFPVITKGAIKDIFDKYRAETEAVRV